MVEYSKVAIAGIVSFVVGILTSVLGLTGTVIGSVFSSVMYSALTGYLEERKKERGGIDINLSKPRLDLELFYIFPLVVILLIELCYMLTFFSSGFSVLFSRLEGVTSNNLFRVMGFGLIIMGIYPMFDSKTVKKINGSLLVFIGLILLGWGFVDLNNPVSNVLGDVLQRVDFFVAAFISLILIYVIFSILVRKSTNTSTKPHSTGRMFKYNNKRQYDYPPADDFNRASRFKRRNYNYGNDGYNQYENYGRYDNYRPDREFDNRNMRENNPREGNGGINSSSDSLKYVSNRRRRR